MKATYTEMTSTRANEVLSLLGDAFGQADMQRDVVGFRVGTCFWDTQAAGEPRHYAYCGTEHSVGSMAEAIALIERLEAGEILRLDEAQAMVSKLGLRR